MTLPSQERLVRYVNGALTGAFDSLLRLGFSDLEAGNMLGGAFVSGQSVIDAATSSSSQYCWDLSIPGDFWGAWILDGGPLLAVQGPDGGILVHVPILQWLSDLTGGTSLSDQCATYFAGLDGTIAAFAAELTAAGAGPGWPEVLGAAREEAITRATPDLAVPWDQAIGNFWKAIPGPVRIMIVIYGALRIAKVAR